MANLNHFQQLVTTYESSFRRLGLPPLVFIGPYELGEEWPEPLTTHRGK